MSATALVEESRAKATVLWNVERERVGSKMEAYRRLAHDIGIGPDWLRKFINENKNIPNLIVYFNICKQYERLCERIEEDNELRRKKIHALRGNGNATATSNLGSDTSALARTAYQETDEI